jgi:primosomal protein N' (replication factor Y) (superfamily II helicase)
VGADQPGRRPQVGVGALSPTDPDTAAPGLFELDEFEPPAPEPEENAATTRPEGRVVRVLPDVPAIDREFDYVVPAAWADDGRSDRLAVGSMVRVDLAGRRIAAWVTALDVEPTDGVRYSELSKLSGVGPDQEILDLSLWAAWRWAGRRVPFLRAASPPRMVAGVPQPTQRTPVPAGPADVFDDAFDHEVAVVRLPPSDDGVSLALAGCRRGDTLVIVADMSRARRLAIALRRAGVTVALGPDEWATAAGGATVVGTRSAAWMPMPNLAAVVVFDEHEESLQEERTPSWHARDVVLERARLRGAPAVLASPAPSLHALRAGRLLRPNRTAEREGWPLVDVLDRRDDDPVKAGPFAARLSERLTDGRVICVLNRKGRSRLLACAACGELVRSEDGTSSMILMDDRLETVDGTESRPIVCAHCGSTMLKNLRAGVTRAREELVALVGEPVGEVTSADDAVPTERVVIGTEAVLHRIDRADIVVFLDLDQELLAPRQRAAEQALALLARAARLLGPRSDGGRLVLQTRQPEHEVVQAALRADPSVVAVAERDRRQALGAPPYGAQVLITGAGAPEFIESFGSPEGVRIRGPVDDQWLLRADTHAPILDALEATPRPAARLRVEVDPLRV